MVISSDSEAIAVFASRNPLTEARVNELFEYFKRVIFQVAVAPGHKGVMDYRVSAPATSSGIRFTALNSTGTTQEPSALIKAVVVPVIPADSLSVQMHFSQEQWQSLDLKNPPARFIVTTQLSGCCFSLGWDNINKILYMGHAQPNGDSQHAVCQTGLSLATHLRRWGGFVGQPAAPGTLQMSHVAADSQRPGGNSLGYAKESAEYSANVLGLISGQSQATSTIHFIVQIFRRGINPSVSSAHMLKFRY